MSLTPDPPASLHMKTNSKYRHTSFSNVQELVSSLSSSDTFKVSQESYHVQIAFQNHCDGALADIQTTSPLQRPIQGFTGKRHSASGILSEFTGGHGCLRDSVHINAMVGAGSIEHLVAHAPLHIRIVVHVFIVESARACVTCTAHDSV